MTSHSRELAHWKARRFHRLKDENSDFVQIHDNVPRWSSGLQPTLSRAASQLAAYGEHERAFSVRELSDLGGMVLAAKRNDKSGRYHADRGQMSELGEDSRRHPPDIVITEKDCLQLDCL
jgi:hypothetical protein